MLLNKLTLQNKTHPMRIKACTKCGEPVESSSPNLKYCKECKNKYQYESFENTTIEIRHKYITAIKHSLNCELCGNFYEIMLLPRVYKYPKYCEEHRNEHKRKLFLEKN